MNKEKEDPNKTLIPIGIKWEWDDSRKCLTYKTSITITDKSEKKKMTKDGKIDLRSGHARIVVQNRQKSGVINNSKTEVRKQINSHVKIEDIKNAAIQMLSERYYIPTNFENYCNDPNSKAILEEFLLYLINYFYWYFELIDSQVFDNSMCIERSEVEIKRTQTAEHMLKLTLKAMAKTYCWLILGLNAIDYHHMNCGKNRVSCGYKDRGLFETFYPFCVFFIWITFRRRDYDIIRLEVGRILRSEAFNSSVKVENILDEENKDSDDSHKTRNKEAILNKYEENRIVLNDFLSKIQNKTSTATLTKRSPVMVAILPSPQESSKWLFKRHGDNLNRYIHGHTEEDQIELFQEIGILGQPMKLFHIKTLTSRGPNEMDDEIDIKSEESRDNNLNGDNTQ